MRSANFQAERAQQTPIATRSTSLPTAGQIYRRAKQGVVEIDTGSGEGTGFVLDERGDIVTNEHVVSGADSLTVNFADGRKAAARPSGSRAR